MSYSIVQKIALWIVPRFVAALLHLTGLTFRVGTVVEAEAIPANVETRPVLYAFWHNCLLLAAWLYRDRGIHILISPSFDGELIARTVKRLGFVPVRGSSSRNGVPALRSMAKALADGAPCAITSDGPLGPVYRAKPGTVAIAQSAAKLAGHSMEVSAFYVYPERAWVLDSWDGFLIPKPFTRVRAVWLRPISISADSQKLDEVQDALERSREIAMRNLPGEAA